MEHTRSNDTQSGVRRVIITEGGKGGPGKTTVACSLIDFLDTEECPRVLIDCDIENVKHGSISHYFKEAQKLDISTKRGLDDFIDAAFTDSYEVVVADLGAGAGKWTFDWFDKMYEPMTEAGVRFLAVGVVTAEYATVETLLHWAKALSDRVDYLVVCNHRNGDNFSGLTLSTAGKTFLAHSNAPIIDLEDRVETIQQELDTRGLTLRTALSARPEVAGPLLSKSSSRMRMRGYLDRMNAQFKTVLDRLLP